MRPSRLSRNHRFLSHSQAAPSVTVQGLKGVYDGPRQVLGGDRTAATVTIDTAARAVNTSNEELPSTPGNRQHVGMLGRETRPAKLKQGNRRQWHYAPSL
jgi:hypothetical protein